MNSLNAVGFLAVGSLMNALPALMPSLVSRGLLIGDMTTSALWLHLMGLLVVMIGIVGMGQEVAAYYRAFRTAPARREVRGAVPQTSFASDERSAAQAA